MMGFAFDVPAEDTGYQLKTEVHVIGYRKQTSLTPSLQRPVVVVKRKKPGKKEVVVFFEYDSALLRSGEKEKLKKVRGRADVYGYASPEGTEEYNFNLSLKRAESVAEFLRSLGVMVLKVEGKGEKSCRTEPEQWHLCRKVEVKVK